MYDHYKKERFPKLLQDPTVPEEDKRKIRDMLNKPWNPHGRRHTATTEISKAIKDPWLLNQYMGWSQKSNTRLKYQHYFADDAVDTVLTEMDGLVLPGKGKDGSKKGRSPLKAIQCPNCDESNKPESKFCAKCKFVLTFDAFDKTMQDAENTKKALAALEQKTATIQASMEDYREQFEQELALHSTRVIQHAIEVRKTKGETNVKLTKQDVEDILTEAMYEDYKHLQEQQQQEEEQQTG